MSDQRSIRVVIADDHPIVLAGFASIIRAEPGFDLVGKFHRGQELLDELANLLPDIAIVDRVMPGLTGPDLLAALEARRSRVRVVMISAALSPTDLVALAQSGFWGVLRKDAAPEEFIHCLRTVGSGQRYYPPIDAIERSSSVSVLAQLTARERQVVELAVQGCSNKFISRKLNLTEGTVKVHMYNIFQKLGLQNRTQLANLIQASARKF